MFIPSPMGFFVLKISKPFAQAFRAFHSASVGFDDSQEVSPWDVGSVVGVGVLVVPAVAAVCVVCVVAVAGVTTMVGMVVGVE